MNGLTKFPLVGDLMTRDVITARPDTPVLEIARLLAEHRIGGVPVVDKSGRVVGMVTSSDLFLKEKPLPRTCRTFPALFETPILPSCIPEGYAMRGPACVAADVMTRKIVCVTEGDSIGRAIQLMARFGIKRLPVLSAAPEAGGKLAGILTRTDIIKLLAAQAEALDVRAAV
ncbi:MAG: CBS domain-containing protein [Chloroflexota bacterium]